MYLNAGLLFRSAVEMYEAISPEVPAAQHRRDALSSIVLATISAEAFVNELTELANSFKHHPKAPGWLKALGDILGEAEESHSSIESKYQLAKFILSAVPFDKGAQPFQDFALLVDVRNMFVHAKPLEAKLESNDKGELVWIKPPLMRRLQSAQIVGVDDAVREAARRNNAKEIIADMFGQIGTRSVSVWACDAVAAIVNDILNSAPKDFPQFSAMLETAYRRDFQRSA